MRMSVPPKQRRAEKSVLADEKIRQHRGKGRGEKITDAITDDGAYRHAIRQESSGGPG
jgi:hypothetical protein